MKMWQKITLGVIAFILIVLFSIFSYIKGSYNSMVMQEEGVTSAWSQVENVYQRRMDLIPNLVNTVKGYAAHESETFKAITEARASVGSIKMTPEMLNDAAAMAKFQKAQTGLGGALQKLMVVQERYPDLKANQNFLALQSQLEGTENRIAVERKRFNDAAKAYNTTIRLFPKNILANMFGFDKKAYFTATEGADKAPEVQF